MGSMLPPTGHRFRSTAVLVVLCATGVAGSACLRSQTATISRTSALYKGGQPEITHGPLRHLEQNVTPLPPAQYRVFDSLFNAFSYYSGGNEPFQWDPSSNTLATIKRGYSEVSDDIFVRTSHDLGQSWTAAKGPLHSSGFGLGRYPGITIRNKDNSTNPADLLYYFTFPVVVNDNFGTTYQGFLDGNLDLLTPAEASTGAGNFIWGSDAKSIFSADGNVAITAADLSGNNLGIRRYSLATGNLTAAIPPALAASNFSDSQDPTRRTSLVVGIGRSGADVYLGIMSRFPASDSANGPRPYPAVTASTDEGQTWSPLEIMPAATLRSYAESVGANPDSTLFPYNQEQDFVVTGAGEYSFLINLFEVNEAKPEVQRVRQIVEVYRSGGNWGIRKVADISGFAFQFNPIPPETARSNQVSNEVHAARTADGKILLVKWVELFDVVVEHDINGDGVRPDTLRTSDVMMTSRKIGSSEWSRSPLNVTCSPTIDRITWIPPVVPNDLADIPLLTVQKRPDGSELTEENRWVTSQLDIEGEQLVMITDVDARQLADVSNRTATANSGLELAPVLPNPVHERGVITFGLPSAENVTVDLWNSRGQRLMRLVDGRMEAGSHTAALDVRGLASGVYYATLNANDQTLTTTISVVR